MSRTTHSLAPCPGTPNCVSSLAEDEEHAVEPIAYTGPHEPVVTRLRELVASMPGASVETADDSYLHATFRSRVLRFVDDLELLADPAASVIHLRSASRKGHWDLGANRRRVEKLRGLFLDRAG